MHHFIDPFSQAVVSNRTSSGGIRDDATASNHILTLAEDYVEALLESDLPAEIQFHDLIHTQQVVKGVNIICTSQGEPEEMREILQLAAWFHDTGYVSGCENHEEKSVLIAKVKLREWKYPADKTDLIKSSILATKYPQRPANQLERILCDADCFHLAEKDYWVKNMKLKEEICLTDQPLSDTHWYLKNLAFLLDHSYFTAYGKLVLENQKQENIKQNITMLKELIL